MADDLFAFVGTYTRLGSEGIYTLKMNGNTGELEQVSLATGIENPSFLHWILLTSTCTRSVK